MCNSVCVSIVCVCDELCLLRQINTKGIRAATELEAYELCTLSNLPLIRERENEGEKLTERGEGENNRERRRGK